MYYYKPVGNFIKNIGLVEIIIIAGVLILLFGSKKIKELSRGLGESTKEAKKVKKEVEEAITETRGKSKNKEK